MLLTAAGAVLPTAAEAQRRGASLVRDAEIENTIRAYAAPLFGAAGLSSDAISVHLVNDRTLNAFVAGGQRIFINTGLLIRADRPAQVIGVLAHEIGHISGGHLARMSDALDTASTAMILSMLFGAAAAVAGSGEGMAAAVLGGQQIAERNFLAFTRTQESAADQAGATFLDQTGQSSSGLIEFLRIIGGQEALAIERQDPYVRTHPMTPDRVAALESRAQRSSFRNAKDNPENIERFRRMQAKLVGYLEGLPATLRKYPESDTSLYGRYARAFAYFRALDFQRSLAETDGLIRDYPNDPYFHELKADILLNMGRVADSLPPAQEAHRLAPNEPLLAYGVGQRLVALDDGSRLDQAIDILRQVTLREPDNSGAWQQLAIAYGRKNDIGMASLASAERYLVIGSLRDAEGQAERASRLLKEGAPGWLRAQDIIAAAKDQRRLQQQRR
ncbi:M48 family metalloprotease [Ferrovibrio sp.]|uniref:M48 family metalloprotease n=1 Tax=Ferrovibrio sp. TaxID=1917215 RepID=UPI0026045F61|nr:M48 family metalloprotease [Ferrovibrio sp.]